MYFDIETAAKALGEGSDPVDALAMSFGVPQCLIDIGKSAALALLPSSLVLSISDQVQKGRESASDDVAKLKKRILLENGIFELDTESGTYRFTSNFSKNGLDSDTADVINKLAGLTSSLSYALQFGTELYTNYLEAASIVNGIGDCINTYRTFLRLQKGNSNSLAKELDPNYSANIFAEEVLRFNTALSAISDFDTVLDNCRSTIINRLSNPALEPQFANADLVSGLGFNVSTLDTSGETSEPIFRLVFGPPRSKKGQFLLSQDGLYYDSQSGGLPEVIGFVPPEKSYLFEQAPNLGGKGKPISLANLNVYYNSVFDPNKIDDSPSMTEHYKADHFLQVLEGQKLKHIYDTSGQIQKVKDDGYSENSAVIINLKEALNSIISRHESKINRRKKQIEIAVKSPSLFGGSTLFTLGKVPINDFSYLKDLSISVAFQDQERLMFRQGEVSGIILPLKPKYVKSVAPDNELKINSLAIPLVGKGSIVFDEDSTDAKATILSLNESVITDGLIAIYNFLDGEVTTPGSTTYNVLNCNGENNYNNAQLVSKDINDTFASGLAIPRLRGITALTSAGTFSGYNSYIQLPDTEEFQNLTYSSSGFTFESWVHYIDPARAYSSNTATRGYSTSSFYRLLLACENNGGINENIDANIAPYSNNTDIVRGMLIGLSRDRQLTRNSAPSNTNSDNPASEGVLFIAPTRSVNASDVGFVNKLSVSSCASGYEICKCSVPISSVLSTGSSISQVIGSSFGHLVFTIDVPNNITKIYVDSELVASATLQNTFGINPTTPPKLPSFKKSNSFEYNLSGTGLAAFANGPKLNQFFTPWIVGGGWTDGSTNGFMGPYSGINSGMNGHVGSVKFYNRPLTTEEVLHNYNMQKGFFKNIDI